MTFNLLDSSWIPLCAPGGSIRWVSPLDLTDPAFADHDVEWGRPEFRVATYELLIGLFAVAFADQLTDSGDWEALYDAPPERAAIAARFARLRPALSLDGEGPRFLQDAAPLKGEARAPDALLIDAPGDNTVKNGADIFAKRGRFAVLSRKAGALALYALQAFAPSGGAGHRTSMRGGGPLTTLVIPQEPTLWTRIAANLPLLSDHDARLAKEDDLTLVFPWTAPTRVSPKGQVTNPGAGSAHPLQAYFGMPRRVRLIFTPNIEKAPCAITGEIDETVVTGFLTQPWGVNYGVWRHRLSPYYRVKPNEAPLPIHAQSGRIGYRDWAAYLFRAPGKDADDLRAVQVADFAKTFPWQGPARLLAAGFVTDNMKCLDWAESEAPLLLLPNKEARDRLAAFAHQTLVGSAGIAESALRGALREALGADVQTTPIAAARDAFWIETEEGFFALLREAATRLGVFGSAAKRDDVERLDVADLGEAWRGRLAGATLRLFDQTTPAQRLGDLDVKQVKRVAEARKRLGLILAGYGKAGPAFFTALGLSVRQPPKAARSAHKAGATP